MKSIQETLKAKPWLGWIIFIATVGIVFLLGILTFQLLKEGRRRYLHTPSSSKHLLDL